MPVSVKQAQGYPFVVSGKTFASPWITVPGIVAGAAYASGDAMGYAFLIPVGGLSGVLQTFAVVDLDKEQLAFDALFFEASPTDLTADNAAMDMTDSDGSKFLGHVSVTGAHYAALNDNAVATVTNCGLAFIAPDGFVRCRLVTRGAPNYTAATDLLVRAACLVD